MKCVADRNVNCANLLGQRYAVRLIDELVVMQHRLVPRYVDELEDLSHPLFGMQHQLLVVDLAHKILVEY